MPPSASVAEAVQVSVSSLSGVSGLMDTVPMTGVVFSTVAVAVPVSVPPSVSVAVAVQVSVSPGASSSPMVWVLPSVPVDHA